MGRIRKCQILGVTFQCSVATKVSGGCAVLKAAPNTGKRRRHILFSPLNAKLTLPGPSLSSYLESSFHRDSPTQPLSLPLRSLI